MTNIYFTADTHYGHANIIGYSTRPFENVTEMNDALVDRFNAVWTPGAILYHLGDIALTPKLAWEFLERIKFKQIHMIWGNHDKDRIAHPKIVWSGDLKDCKFGPEKIPTTLCHYSMRTWNKRHHGAYHLFGHTHGAMQGIGRSMDVGVDTNNMYPYSWEEVNEKLSKIPIAYVHHETN